MAGGIHTFNSEGRKGQMFSDVPKFTIYVGYYSGAMLVYILNIRLCVAIG